MAISKLRKPYMNIVYTHDIFSGQKYGGISRYFFELIKRIPADTADTRVFAGLHINDYIKKMPGITGIMVPELKHTGTMRMEINNIIQRLMLLKLNDTTIIHQTHYERFSPPKRAKYIITVYDMITERFPEFFRGQKKISDLKKECCLQADKIIAISNSTKKDLISIFGIDPAKIVVIYLGSSLSENTICSKETIYPGPYILYVGQRGGYKNMSKLLQAFSESDALKKDFHLICFGGGPFDNNEKKELKTLGLRKLVHHVSGNDSLLTTYYKNATAYVCPSRYEGFGIPLLEAMGLSCPVICSDKSSIPEVVGTAGVYFNPDNVSSIRRALEDTLFNESVLLDLKKRGCQRESIFSWDKCASETVDLYQSVLR